MAYVSESVRKLAREQLVAHGEKDTDPSDSTVLDMCYCALFGLRYLPTRQGRTVDIPGKRAVVDAFDGRSISNLPKQMQSIIEDARKTIAEYDDQGFIPEFVI